MTHAPSPEPHAVDRYVGERIARRRSALGLSQMALAGRVGVSFQQLQKYESGTNRVSASRLFALATALGASVTEFFPPETRTPPAGPDLHLLTASADGRAVAGAFPRIPDPKVRRAVARIVEQLASP